MTDTDFLYTPINHGFLLGLLKNYKRPNDKIAYMIEKGELITIKRGLYVFSEAYRKGNISKYLLANTLRGPSYISLFSALAYHGLIPEKVTMVESATTNRSKLISTSVGNFKYYVTSNKVFHVGIDYAKVNDKTAFLIASPIKALCDIIWNTPRMGVHGIEAMKVFLRDNIRFDMDNLKEMDIKILEKCIASGKKSKQLTHLLHLIKTYK